MTSKRLQKPAADSAPQSMGLIGLDFVQNAPDYTHTKLAVRNFITASLTES